MTVIAYDGKLLVSDSCITDVEHGDIVIGGTKLKRTAAGAIMGGSGDADFRAMEALFDRVRKEEDLPSAAQIAACRLEYHGIIILQDGSLWAIDSGVNEELGDDPWWGACVPATIPFACGSGGRLAYAFMLAGKTAREAVMMTCARNAYCCLPVHQMRLEPAKPMPRKKKKR